MSRRKNKTHYGDGEIILQCPDKHRLGFIIVPNRKNPHPGLLGRTDQRIEVGKEVLGTGPLTPARRVPYGYPLHETCRVCHPDGRNHHYAASRDDVEKCLVKLRDTPSTTLTLQ